MTQVPRRSETRQVRLVLGSGSPRRKALLERAGYRFDIDPADIDESPVPGESAAEMTMRLAVGKAAAVAARSQPDAVALGADTTVVLDGETLGKPEDEADAARILLRLSGRTHEVLTAWALVEASGARRCLVGLSRSSVTMREVSFREAEVYAAGGEPLDKAGAYAVQGEGGRFVAAVHGSLDNVIGLPVAEVVRGLGALGLVSVREAK